LGGGCGLRGAGAFVDYYSSNHWSYWKYLDAHCFYYGIAYFFNVLTAAYFNLLRSRFQTHLWDLVGYHTSEVKRHWEALQHNAMHDVPSGLLNSQGLTAELEESLKLHAGNEGYLLVAHVRFFRVPELVSIVGSVKVDESLRQLASLLEKHLAGLGRSRAGGAGHPGHRPAQPDGRCRCRCDPCKQLPTRATPLTWGSLQCTSKWPSAWQRSGWTLMPRPMN